MTAGVLRPTLTSSGKPWEAAPGSRGGAQHVPAASRPLRSCSRLRGMGTSGSFGGAVEKRHREVCSGRVVMKPGGLDATSGLKTPVAHSGEVSKRKGFSGYTFFYPFPKPSLGTGYRIGLCWLYPAALLPRVKTGKRGEAQ